MEKKRAKVNDFLDVSITEEGRITFQEAITLIDVCAESTERLESLLFQAGHCMCHCLLPNANSKQVVRRRKLAN